MASLFIPHGSVDLDASVMAYGLLAFAPGLLGYAAIALLGRVLYAANRGREAATATVAGWLVVFGADAALIFSWHRRPVVALGLGNAIGMTVAGVLLMVAVRRTVGRGVFDGLGRTAAAGLTAAAASGAAGWSVGSALGWTSSPVALVVGPLCTVLALAVFAAVVLPLDGADLRPLVTRFVDQLRARALLPRRRGTVRDGDGEGGGADGGGGGGVGGADGSGGGGRGGGGNAGDDS
jgi:putative peptidoglycan lipid II flippase